MVERQCVDCPQLLGIEDDPTDGRCQECDSKRLTKPASKRASRRKTATKTGGK